MIQRRGFLGAMLALAAAPTIAGYRPTQLGRAISRGRYVSVLDFGADPTGRTHSDDAFRQAMKACESSGVVYVPPGTYRLSPAPITRSQARVSR